MPSAKTVLIESHGRLVGLVTVKDVLRFSLWHEDSTHSDSIVGADLEDMLEEAGVLARESWQAVVRWVKGERGSNRGLEL